MRLGVKRVIARKKLPIIASAAMAAAAIGSSVGVSSASITVNGSYSSDFGSALSLQTIGTGFGSPTVSGTPPDETNGSQLDAAYGVIENGDLYLLITGDLQDNGNHMDIFISGNGAGQFTLNETADSGYLNNANGSKFSPNFGDGATNVIDINDYEGTVYSDVYNLVTNKASTGSFSISNSQGPNNVSGITEAFNNTNDTAMGVATGAAASPANDESVTTGFELAIPLAQLGNPSGSIDVLADITGGDDKYISNQFLAGLPVGTGNLATNTFNFGSTNSQFFVVPAGPAVIYWAGSAADTSGDHMTWDVQSNYNWYNSGGQAYYVNGDAVTFDDTGTPYYNVTLNTTVTPDSVMVNNSAGNYVISGSGTIGGSASLTKEGTDSLTLSTTNTYTGGTTIGNGTFIIGNSSAIPTGSSVSFGDGSHAGTLDLGGIGATVGSLSTATGGSGTIINNGSQAAALVFAGGTGSSTFTGTIVNGGSQTGLTVTSGTLNLQGALSYSGATTLSGGTLIITGGTNPETLNGNFNAGTGNLTIGGYTDVSFNLTLNGTLNYTGTTQINSYGTLTLGSSVSSMASSLIDVFGTFSPNASTFTIGGGSTAQTLEGGLVYLDPHAGSVGEVIVGGGSGTLDIGANGTLNVTNPGPALAAMTVEGNVALTTVGTGGSTLELQVDPDLTGTNDELDVSGGITLGGILDVTAYNADRFTSGDSYTLISDPSDGITGSFATVDLPVLGAGQQWITTETSSAYEISIFSPTIYWNNYSGNGLWDINTSQNWNDVTDSINPIVYNDGDLVIFDDAHNNGNYNVTLNTTVMPGGVTVNNSAGNYVISGTGTIGGFTGLVKEGSASLTLSTANTYTGGTQIQNGTLIVGNASAIPVGGAVTFSDADEDSAYLDLGGIGATVGSLAMVKGSAGYITNNGTQAAALTFAGGTTSSTFGGTIQDGSSQTSLTVNSGTLLLNGTLSYSGTTTLNGGILQIGGPHNYQLNGAFAGGTAGSLIVGDGTNSTDLTLNGAINSAGTIKVDSYATLNLGSNTSSIASSSIAVYGNLNLEDTSGFMLGGSAPQTLTGGHTTGDPGGAGNTATITSASTLTIGPDGTLEPFNAVGEATLTIDGNLSFGTSGGTLMVRINPDTTGTNDEVVMGAGDVATIDGGTLDLVPTDGDTFKTGSSYTLISDATGTGFSTSNLSTLPIPTSSEWVTTINSSGYVISLEALALYWTGAQSPNNAWDINNTVNWETPSDTPSVYMDGYGVTFDDAHNTSGNYNVNLNTTVQPYSVTVNNSAGNYVISGTGSIGGSATLLKEGTDNLTLSTANTYTGTTTVGNGTLIVGNSSAIPTGGTVTFGDSNNDSGTLDLNGIGATVGGLSVVGTGAQTITNNGTQAAALTFDGGSSTFTGAIHDGNSQTSLKVTGGTLNLQGALSYSGATTLTGGTLVITGGTNPETLNGNFNAGAGNLDVGGYTNVPFNLTLNGALNYTGNTQINDYGTLALGTSVSSMASATISVFGTFSPNASTFTIGGGATLQTLTGGLSHYLPDAGSVGEVIVGGGAGTLAIGANGTLNVTDPGPALSTITVEGNVALTTVGTGGSTLEFQADADLSNDNDELILSGSGEMTLAGILDVTGFNADPFVQGDTYTLIDAPGGINGAFATIDLPALPVGLTWHKSINSDEYIITVGGGESTPATLYWTGSLSPAWDTSSTNWYDSTDSLANATYADTDNVNFDDTANGSPVNTYTVTLNTTVMPGSVSVNNSAGNYIISGTGSIAGSTSLVKEGSDSLTLSTANSFTGGTTIGNGTLIVGNSSAIPSGSSVTFGDGTNNGTLDLGGIGATVGALAVTAGSNGTVTNNGTQSATLTFAGGTNAASTFSGTIQNGTSQTVLTVNSGSLTLSSANTYSGNTTINGGTLALGASGSIANSSLITVQSNGAFNVSAVSGGFVLGGSNAQELNGNGNVIGNITVGAQGNLSPGDAIGPLTVTGNVNLDGTFSAQVDPDNNESPPNDQLVTSNSGTVSLGGTLTVTPSNSDPLTNGESYTLISATGGITGGAFSTVNLPTLNSGLTWDTTLMNTVTPQSNYTISVVNTVPTGFTSGTRFYTAALAQNQSYNGFYIQRLAGAGSRQTNVQFLGGSVSSPTGTTLSVQFQNAPAGNAQYPLLSDMAVIDGTGSDTYVLQMSYSVAPQSGSALSPVLAAYNPHTTTADGQSLITNTFVSAVLLNTSGTPVEYNGAYAGQDVVGDYGINTSNDTVWAVLNYSDDDFVVLERADGDWLGTGSVNAADLDDVVRGLGGSTLDPNGNAVWSKFAFDGSTGVDAADLDDTVRGLGAQEAAGEAAGVGGGLTFSSPSDVPEPGSLALLAVGAVGMMIRRRKK
ncbi:MAG TPA: autotransporter-associated beta strand repeat-containing protein [Phycisphaerae bacterium]|nr:autotransporter-associated beta strand repeat-containing protein [Phycisphaerae bacterium]